MQGDLPRLKQKQNVNTTAYTSLYSLLIWLDGVSTLQTKQQSCLEEELRIFTYSCFKGFLFQFGKESASRFESSVGE